MKLRIVLLVIITVCAIAVHAQKTAKEYFNMSSQLYVEGNQKEALILTKRGLEVFEQDEQLQKLLEILQKKNNNSQQNQQQNQNQNNDSNSDSNDSSQGGNQGNKDEQKEQDSKSGENKHNNQQQQSGDQQQGQKSQAKPGEEGKEQYTKGKISENEAEMLLRTIENNERAIQLKLQKQKKEQQKRQTIEKNW